MADKLMVDVDEIESSSEEETEQHDELNEERMKKEEIMANLKHLNLLGSSGPAVTSPSDAGESGSRKGAESGQKKLGDLNIKEPSISASSDNDEEGDDSVDHLEV